MSEKQLSLTVQNWQSEELLVYMRPDTLADLGARSQDILAIRNSKDKVTYARCKPTHPDFVKENTIAMNKLFRSNAEVVIGDRVEVRKLKHYDAKNVTLTPVGRIPPISELFVVSALELSVIRVDNIVTFQYFGGDVSFRVAKLSPAPTKENGEVAVIVRDTQVTLSGV